MPLKIILTVVLVVTFLILDWNKVCRETEVATILAWLVLSFILYAIWH